MLRIPRRVIAMLFIAIAAVVAFWLIRKYRTAPNLNYENVVVTDTGGKTVDLTQYRGKVVFVSYWATWCPDCIKEMPSIQKLADQCDRSAVVFLMISDESEDKINNFVSSHDYNLTFLKSVSRHQENNIYTLPTTYIFDEEGYEVSSRAGSADWNDPAVVAMIRELTEK